MNRGTVEPPYNTLFFIEVFLLILTITFHRSRHRLIHRITIAVINRGTVEPWFAFSRETHTVAEKTDHVSSEAPPLQSQAPRPRNG